MTISATHKQIWIESIEKRRCDLLAVVDWDLFKDWGRSGVPVGLVSNELRMALDVLYSGLDMELGRRFLDRCLALVERTEMEGRLAAEADRPGFRLTRSEFLVCKAHALAIQENRTQPDILRQAAEDFLAWIAGFEKSPSTWDDQNQSYFLAAVSSLLIAGDASEAHRLFDRAPKANWHHPEGLLWRGLCEEVTSQQRVSEASKVMLQHRFDVIRNPYYRSPLFDRISKLRFEFGAIMWKYVEHPEATEIDWQGVIELVSR